MQTSQKQAASGSRGVSGGLPLAAISVGPSGVRVGPVWDVTKIALASFTTLGAMFTMFSRLQAAGWRMGSQ